MQCVSRSPPSEAGVSAFTFSKRGIMAFVCPYRNRKCSCSLSLEIAKFPSENVCICPGGTPVDGAGCDHHGKHACRSCEDNFHMTAEHVLPKVCEPDLDCVCEHGRTIWVLQSTASMHWEYGGIFLRRHAPRP